MSNEFHSWPGNNVTPETFSRSGPLGAMRQPTFNQSERESEGAAMMTDTVMSRRIIGTAWPRHFNRPIALATNENIKAVGLPEWSEDDQQFAKAVQTLMQADEIEGLALELDGIQEPPKEPVSGGSDDIGDVSWNVPTISLRFPANFSGLAGHHWANAMAMATPIAHKGAVAGAKVLAATMLDLLEDPGLIEDAWSYFQEEQLSQVEYVPFIGPNDPPAIEKNSDTMGEFQERLEDVKTFFW